MRTVVAIFAIAMAACGRSPAPTAPEPSKDPQTQRPNHRVNDRALEDRAPGRLDRVDIVDPVDRLQDPDPAPDPFDPGPVDNPAADDGGTVPSAMTWKAVFMTGDASIPAFDNGRRDVRQAWLKKGIKAQNTRQLSVSRAAQSGDIRASSVENLRASFSDLRLGQQDGCLLFMTSHGSPSGFQLERSTLRPAQFRQIIDDMCGTRPTVLLVSACYSGVMLQDRGLKTDNRVILTAARHDRTSFGCGPEDQYTYWDGCLLDAIPRATSWSGLHDDVNSCITSKEGGMYTPSLPQKWIGKAMTDVPLPGAGSS